jgi:hypothetical protein
MSAADHINEAQKLRVFHMSWHKQPPHTIIKDIINNFDGNNVHPDVLHMGTELAARHAYRTHLHEYEIDPDVVDPVTHGDAQYIMDMVTAHPERRQSKAFVENMRNKQQELWETVPAQPEDALKRNVVLPYRNYAEDIGSISYIVPKHLVTQGKVRHVGVTNIENSVLDYDFISPSRKT